MASLDATIAGQNTAIAAESIRLGICYVGAIRNNAQQMCELLKPPPHTFGLFGMAIGYPNVSGKGDIKPRLPMREICHHETWNEDDQESNFAAFDKSLGAFYIEQSKFGRKPWSEFISGNLASGDMDSRERTRNVLHNQSFRLE